MVKYFKAVRPNGRDFHSNTVDYAAGLAGDAIIHPKSKRGSDDAAHYISVSVEPGDCTGFSWPEGGARLFEVKPVGRAWTPHKNMLPNKRAAVAVKVIRELPAYMLFGPQGEAVVALIETFSTLTRSQRDAMYRARSDQWWDAYAVANAGRADRAGLSAALDALGGRLIVWFDGDSAYGAALAVLLRHTIGADGFEQKHYDALVAPWVKVTGQKAHPEDLVF